MQPSGTAWLLSEIFLLDCFSTLTAKKLVNFLLTMSFARTKQNIARELLNSFLYCLKYLFSVCI